MPKHSSNAHFSNLTHRSARQRVIEELTLRARWLTQQLVLRRWRLDNLASHIMFEDIFKLSKPPYPLYRKILFKILYEHGYKMSEIAEVFGRHHSTISRGTKRLDVKEFEHLYKALKEKNEHYKPELQN